MFWVFRLAEQLRGWMISQEEEKKRSKKSSGQTQSALPGDGKPHKGKLRGKRKKDYPALRRMGTHVNPSQPSVVGTKGATAYPMQLFGGGFDPREQLLDAIPRRNDTFYVLSFSTVSIGVS